MIDKARLLELLRSDARPLFVVIDASHSRAILPWLQASGLAHASLFSGVSAVTLAECAPYLVRLDSSGKWLAPIVDALWGCSSLFFVNATEDAARVRIQLKKWLRTRLPDGTQGLFRFYDPRVWRRTMLHAEQSQRLHAFDGGIVRYVTELDEGRSALVFRPAQNQVASARWLSTAAAVEAERIRLQGRECTTTVLLA